MTISLSSSSLPIVELVELPIFKDEADVEKRLVAYKDSYECHFGPKLHPVLGEAKPTLKLWLQTEPGQGIQLKGKITREHRFTAMADFQPFNAVSFEANYSSLEDRILHTAAMISADNADGLKMLCDPPLYSTDTHPRSLSSFYFTPSNAGERSRPSRQNIPWFCYFSDTSINIQIPISL